ncbi:MAG TPA: protease complex subunit PrcB family protein [Symbiobacteriaceae bacterium]|jgi:hypothetical protein
MEFLLVSRPQEKLVLQGDLVPATVSLKEVKWEQEVALVVDLGERRTGGHGVEILGVDAGADQLVVRLRVSQPGPGSFVAQVLTHPFAVHRVDRSKLKSGPVTIVAKDALGNELGRQVVHL